MGVYPQMAILIGKVMFKSSKFRGTPLQTNPYGTQWLTIFAPSRMMGMSCRMFKAAESSEHLGMPQTDTCTIAYPCVHGFLDIPRCIILVHLKGHSTQFLAVSSIRCEQSPRMTVKSIGKPSGESMWSTHSFAEPQMLTEINPLVQYETK